MKTKKKKLYTKFDWRILRCSCYNYSIFTTQRDRQKKKMREKSLKIIFLIKKENFYHFLIEPDIIIIIMYLSFFYTISI
jgi:hypothetical protein